MSAFVVIAAILAVIALAWILVPLLRKREQGPGPGREASNLAILKQQLAELEADRANGTLTEERFQQAKDELERRVIEEVRAPAPAGGKSPRLRRWTAAALGTAVPVLAVGLYLLLGRPDSFSQQGTAVGQHDVSHEQIEGMVAKLAERLQREPENAQGWGILARSYAAMQRYPESVRAFARYIELVPGDADALADYADALAMTQGRVISGKPLELVKRALQIDPNHWKALAIAGTEAFDRKDYKTAVAYWEKAQRTAPPDSDAAKSLADSVAEARELGGIKSAAKLPESATKPVATVAAVQGTVSLSPALAREVDPADTVFILARAPQGPKMPLAVVKRQVKDLPTTFTLDDTQAMAPGLNISSFPEVVIVARVSKTANAIAQPGDFEGHSSPTRVGSRDVRVVIADRVR